MSIEMVSALRINESRERRDLLHTRRFNGFRHILDRGHSMALG